MKRIAMIATLAASNAYAQLDRAGNVIETDYSGTGDLSDMALGGLLVGAIYLIWKKFFG